MILLALKKLRELSRSAEMRKPLPAVVPGAHKWIYRPSRSWILAKDNQKGKTAENNCAPGAQIHFVGLDVVG